MHNSLARFQIAALKTVALFISVPLIVSAAPPLPSDVDVYSQLCKIGSQTTVVASSEVGLISRRILGGEGKISASKLQDEFPGIRDEKNRLQATQSFQDCMYKYVDKFHSATTKLPATQATLVGPNVSEERRKEIVYLANELEGFKLKMAKIIASLPLEMYDKRTSLETKPKDDPRLIGLGDYSKYKAFQSASGILDFTSATNSDLVLLCTSYKDEILDYRNFARQYAPLNLPNYSPSVEVQRICQAVKRGR